MTDVCVQHAPHGQAPAQPRVLIWRAAALRELTPGLHSVTEGHRFARAKLGQFSFLGDAVANFKAYWSMRDDHLNAAEKHAGTHLLGLLMHAPAFCTTTSARLGRLPT